MSHFMTILGITWIIVITEQRTKKLCLKNKYKKNFCLFVRNSMSGGGRKGGWEGGSAVCIILASFNKHCALKRI
jgi:hypothetical protein